MFIIGPYSIFPFYSRLIPTVRWFVLILLLQRSGMSLNSWPCHLEFSYRTDTGCSYQEIIIWVDWHGLCKHRVILEIKLNTEWRNNNFTKHLTIRTPTKDMGIGGVGGVKKSWWWWWWWWWWWYLMGLEVTDKSKDLVYMSKYTLTTTKLLIIFLSYFYRKSY